MEIKKTMSDIPFPTALMKRTNIPGDKYAEIEANEMKEFMIMCNPDITMKYFLTQEQAQLKKGTEVLVKYGPLKGGWLALKRIARCHPFHSDDYDIYDPVP